MSDVYLGEDMKTKREFYIPYGAFSTHIHLIGGTGKGKTTAIHTMLHPLIQSRHPKHAFFIIDRLGNLSWELLLWMSSKYCTQQARDRLLYIEPSREDVVIGFNPLQHTTQQHGYYKVGRATDIILRAWESVNIEAMPRLARWVFNAFWAAAQLGLTIADCGHLLMPGSQYHQPILNALPPLLKAEWEEIAGARGQEAVRILESSRNRLKPWFEAPILRNMFGTTKGRLNVADFMRDRKIVLINLAPQNRLSPQLGDAIGALILNEVLATARSFPMGERHPTFLVLDEFQNFVGPDIESALPEVRQLGLRLILSHQSLSQLERGDYDLTNMIFQAQTRIAFGVQGEDADLLGKEFASLSYDPKRVKHEQYHIRQRIAGQEIVNLRNWNDAATDAKNWSENYGQTWGRTQSIGDNSEHDNITRSKGESRGQSNSKGKSGGRSESHSSGESQHLKPIYEEREELSSVSFFTGDEWDRMWAKRARLLPTGVALVRVVNEPGIHQVAVQNSSFSFLSWDRSEISKRLPNVIEKLDQMLDKNFRSEYFMTPQVIEQETQKRLEQFISTSSYKANEKPFTGTDNTQTGSVFHD